MTEQKKGKQARNCMDDFFMDSDTVCLATEFTGLMQTPPLDEAERDSLQDIASFLPRVCVDKTEQEQS